MGVYVWFTADLQSGRKSTNRRCWCALKDFVFHLVFSHHFSEEEDVGSWVHTRRGCRGWKQNSWCLFLWSSTLNPWLKLEALCFMDYSIPVMSLNPVYMLTERPSTINCQHCIADMATCILLPVCHRLTYVSIWMLSPVKTSNNIELFHFSPPVYTGCACVPTPLRSGSRVDRTPF